MKLNRIAQHAALALLIMIGFAGTTVTATSTGTKTASDTSTSTTPDKASGGNVQGYASDSVLQNGTIVQLVSGGSKKVTSATSKNMQQMYGVTVDPHMLSLTISDDSLKNEAFVATVGTYQVLVSTQNGTIKSGDFVTLSSIDGVGMKAGTDESTVLGRAVGGFDGKVNAIGSLTLKDTDGKTDKSVQIGLVPVSINIQRNPNIKSTKANVPQWLQAAGQAIAQKPVGPLRIYLSIAITGLCVIVGLVTLYAGIRNAMIAIGRNPLSKKSIFRGLLEVILTSFLILIIGLFAVYLLLKL